LKIFGKASGLLKEIKKDIDNIVGNPKIRK
jgi:hypothetical protein